MRVLGSRVILRLVVALVLASGAALPAVAGNLEQSELQELEALLARLGFQPGSVDGVADERTRAAILRYHAFAALSGPGEPSKALLIELRAVERALAAMQEAAVPAGAAAPGSAVTSQGPDPNAETGEPTEPIETTALEEPPAPAVPDVPPVAEPEAVDQLFPEKLEAPDAAEEQEDREVEEIMAILSPFKKALDSGQISPGELARTLNAEGRADFERALYDRAVAEFGAAIHLDPGFAAAFHNRGVAHEAAGRRDRAAEDFERAFELGFGRLKLGGAGE